MAMMETTGANAIVWQGRSGRLYAGMRQNLDQFVLTDGDFHLLLAGAIVLWVGSSADLVTDPASRLRFRLALEKASGVIRLPDPGDDSARLSILVDLEGGHLAPGPAVQAA